MKKLSITAVLVAACMLVFAQGARTQDAAPKVHSMTGCLRRNCAKQLYAVRSRKGSEDSGDRVVVCQPRSSRWTQDRDYRYSGSSKRRGSRCECAQGSALHESRFDQDDFHNLPVVFYETLPPGCTVAAYPGDFFHSCFFAPPSFALPFLRLLSAN